MEMQTIQFYPIGTKVYDSRGVCGQNGFICRITTDTYVIVKVNIYNNNGLTYEVESKGMNQSHIIAHENVCLTVESAEKRYISQFRKSYKRSLDSYEAGLRVFEELEINQQEK